MKIASVLIENFRCFDRLEVEFERCHALIGENGCGKTSVLEAISLATSRSSPANRLDEQDFHIADAGPLRIEVRFSEPFLIKVPDGYATQDVPCDRIVLSAHRRDKPTPGSAFSGPIVAQQVAVPMAYASGVVPTLPEGISGNIPSAIRKTDEGFELSRKSGKTMELTNRQLSLQNDVVGLPNIFYFDRDREKETKVSFGSLLGKIAKDLNWRFRKSWAPEALVETWDAFYNTVLAGLDASKTDRIIAPLRERMKAFFGRDFRDLELSLLNIEQPFSKAFFSRRTATNQIEQANLGSGVSILMSYFLLDIVSRLSKESFSFLIDEPELHLHPQLQQRLFEEFKSAGFQVIYTTQSDTFIDVAEWKSIARFSTSFTVTPTKDAVDEMFAGKAIHEHLDEIKKWHQQKSVFFREDNQLFFSRKCLLVEGPAEKYGIPILAGKLGVNLGDVTLLSCNGKSKIPYYQLLCRAFGIPFFTLFDLDSKAATDVENALSTSGADGDALGCLSTSFEKVLGISPNVDHKASETLTLIDNIDPRHLPGELVNLLEKMSRWSLTTVNG